MEKLKKKKDFKSADPDAVQMLIDEFKRAAGSELMFNFQELKGAWGYKGGRIYYEKYSKFIRTLRETSKKMNLRFLDGEIYYFDGKLWCPIDSYVIWCAYVQFMDEIGIYPMIMDKGAYTSYMINVIMIYNPLRPRPDLIAFENGVLDTSQMMFDGFSPEYHVTKMHPYRFDSKAACPMWQAFLKEVLPDPNARLILQMFLALGLTQRATVDASYKKQNLYSVELCLLLVGAGANGKSVIYNTAMGIYGRDRISGADYDELTSTGDEGMRARRMLRGCLFNWSSDSDVRQFGKRTGVFKKIVSGEPVTDRKIGGDVETNFNMPYLIFNLNDLPSSNDMSLGFIRRLQYISFEKVIPKERQNKHLAQDLVQEYPGIFNWLIRGYRELRRRKFVFPSSDGNYRLLLRTMMRTNPVHAFISAYRIRPSANAKGEISVWITAAKLQESLRRFCELNDASEVPPQMFGATMTSHGFIKRRASAGMVYNVYGCTEESLGVPFSIDIDGAKFDSIDAQIKGESSILDRDD